MATDQVCVIDWHLHPMRVELWYGAWAPAAERALAFGAKSWTLTRSEDDPLHFRQTSLWEDRADFERYWFSPEIARVREEILNYYNKPLYPTWHTQLAAGGAEQERPAAGTEEASAPGGEAEGATEPQEVTAR